MSDESWETWYEPRSPDDLIQKWHTLRVEPRRIEYDDGRSDETVNVLGLNTWDSCGGGLRPITRALFDQLVIEMRRFYDAFDDDEIEAMNRARHAEMVAADLRQKREAEASYTPRHRTATPGYIYVLSDAHGTYKIGRAKVLDRRILQLKAALPFPVEHVHTIASNDIGWAESHIHQRFAHCRLNSEWFALTGDELAALQSTARLDREDRRL